MMAMMARILFTHCLRDHELTPENTYVRPDGARECRTCRRSTKRTQRKLRTRGNQVEIVRLKSVPCADCGGRFHPACMDFDHLPGHQKVASVSRLWNTKKKLLEEIQKCEVVCANCHRLRTWRRRRGDEPAVPLPPRSPGPDPPGPLHEGKREF